MRAYVCVCVRGPFNPPRHRRCTIEREYNCVARLAVVARLCRRMMTVSSSLRGHLGRGTRGLGECTTMAQLARCAGARLCVCVCVRACVCVWCAWAGLCGRGQHAGWWGKNAGAKKMTFVCPPFIQSAAQATRAADAGGRRRPDARADAAGGAHQGCGDPALWPAQELGSAHPRGPAF
jgi:hypothetical protein